MLLDHTITERPLPDNATGACRGWISEEIARSVTADTALETLRDLEWYFGGASPNSQEEEKWRDPLL